MLLRQFDGGETCRRPPILPCREQKRQAHHVGKVRFAALVRDDAHDAERLCHRTASWMDSSHSSKPDRRSRRGDEACSRAFDGCSSSSRQEWMGDSSMLRFDGIKCVRCCYSCDLPKEIEWKAKVGIGLRPRKVRSGTCGSASVPRRKLHVVNQSHISEMSCNGNEGMALAHLLDGFQRRSIHHFDVIHPAAVVFDGLSYA